MSDSLKSSIRENHDIAIIGMSCIFPGASNLGEFWSNLINGYSAIGPVPAHRWVGADNFVRSSGHEARLECQTGGFIQQEIRINPQRYGILPNAIKNGDPDQFFMLKLIDDALADANVEDSSALRKRTDLLIGNGGYTGQKLGEMLMRSEIISNVIRLLEREFTEKIGGSKEEMEQYLRDQLPENSVETVSTCIPNIVASRAANRLNLGGSAFVIDAACASSLVALEDGILRLRLGRCDLAVAAGLFLKNYPTFWQVFSRLGALSADGTIRPMDAEANGLVVGEGGGAVVLKRLEDAVRDGDPVYAVIKGIGSSSDGRAVDVLAPSTKGQEIALERAYEDAALDRNSIDYLELHGTGTAAGDLAEAQTICSFFGTQEGPAVSRSMGSVKSMLGHTMPAAGMSGLIKTALALSNRSIPPTLNCQSPREELAGAPFYVNIDSRPWVKCPQAGPRRAGINAFGFGGINVHAILEEVPVGSQEIKRRTIRTPQTRASELFAFTGDDIASLKSVVAKLQSILEQTEDKVSLATVACALQSEFEQQHACKLTVVATDLDDLRNKLSRVIEVESNFEEALADEDDIWFSASANQEFGKVACIFPGLAFPGLTGEYANHLKELCLHFPEVLNEFNQFETRDRHPEDTTPTSAILWPHSFLDESVKARFYDRLAPPRIDLALQQNENQTPDQRYLAAMGVSLSNWVSWTILKKLGLQPDFVIGQSQGEMVAACVAGIFEFSRLAPGYFKALTMNWDFDENLRSAFVWCPHEELTEGIKAHDGISVAIHMTPRASLLGGVESELSRFAEELREAGHFVQMLPYAPIHTSAFSALREKLSRAFEEDTDLVNTPTLPIYSAITGERFPEDPDEIRSVLARNLDEPVYMWQTMCRMYDDGARIFVQAGGGQVASTLDDILPDRTETKGVALDQEGVNPITQLNRLCGELVTLGVPLNLSALYEDRGTNEHTLDELLHLDKEDKLAIPIRMDWSVFEKSGVPELKQELLATAEEPASVSATEEKTQRVAASTEDASPAVDDTVNQPVEVDQQVEFPEVGQLPMIGTVLAFVPHRSCETERIFRLDDDVFFEDHVFINGSGHRPIEECLPVLPMTFSIETAAEVASLLEPELGVVGFANIRARRWIQMEDADQVSIRCRAQVVEQFDGRNAVDVEIFEGERICFSATVLFDEVYAGLDDMDPIPNPEVSSSSYEWPCTPAQIYSHKYLFHGPRLQLISNLGIFGDDSFEAELVVPDNATLFASGINYPLIVDPSLFDAIGQAVGLWALAKGNYILPTGVERIKLFGPTPPPGTRVRITAETLELSRETKRAEFRGTVDNGHGEPWIQFSGWTDYVFDWKINTINWMRSPRHFVLGNELAIPVEPSSVLLFVEKRDISRSFLEQAMRCCLTSNEIAHVKEITDLQLQREFVMSRAAVKDAARLWISRNTDQPIPHPLEIEVMSDEAGRPWLSWHGEIVLPYLSLSHKPTLAVGIASECEVGIDIEPEAAVDVSLATHILDDTELEMVQAEFGRLDSSILTQIWCAKEAVAKRFGTGLGGRPRDFAIVDIDPQRQEFLIRNIGSGETEVVSIFKHMNHSIAVTGNHAETARTNPEYAL